MFLLGFAPTGILTLSLAFLSTLCYNRVNTRDCVSILPCSVSYTGQGASLEWGGSMSKLKKFFNRNKRYKIVHEDGLNVLVETEWSKARTEKRRFLINMLLSVISAISAIAAAVFSALTYINS